MIEVRSAKQDDYDDAANDDAAARLQCAETSALPKQPCDVTPQKFAEQLVFSEDGTTKTIDGEGCRSRTLELSKGPNKGITLVRYYPWCEVEPSDRAMKQAFLKKQQESRRPGKAQKPNVRLYFKSLIPTIHPHPSHPSHRSRSSFLPSIVITNPSSLPSTVIIHH